MAAARLAQKDVQARWVLAERHAHNSDDDDETDSSRLDVTMSPQRQPASPEWSGSSNRRRARRADASSLAVMFTCDHVRELQPREWQEQPLGTGTYGIVYKATWRGRDVAVKVMKLPDRGNVTHVTPAARNRAEQVRF